MPFVRAQSSIRISLTLNSILISWVPISYNRNTEGCISMVMSWFYQCSMQHGAYSKCPCRLCHNFFQNSWKASKKFIRSDWFNGLTPKWVDLNFCTPSLIKLAKTKFIIPSHGFHYSHLNRVHEVQGGGCQEGTMSPAVGHCSIAPMRILDLKNSREN